MIWLTWRLTRLQLAAVAAMAAAIIVVSAVTGPHLAALARRSSTVFDQLTSTDRSLFYAGIVVLAVVPPLIGAFWGAPVVARELEAGTHRLVWTQSVTRGRWLAARAGLTCVAAAAAAGAISLAITWWSSALDGAVSATRGALPTRLTPVTFAMRGLVPVGYAVFAVTLGIALGAVVRRTLPAMALTLALYVAVQICVPIWVRPALLPPVTALVPYSSATFDGISLDEAQVATISVHTPDRDDWVLVDRTVDGGRHAAALPAWFAACLPPEGSVAAGTAVRAPARSLDACLARLTDDGYRQQVVYQPADRFWPLQWAETGVYLALSALLAGFTFWWVRRRLT